MAPGATRADDRAMLLLVLASPTIAAVLHVSSPPMLSSSSSPSSSAKLFVEGRLAVASRLGRTESVDARETSLPFRDDEPRDPGLACSSPLWSL